ncbi:MAG TPA: CPBP family glutamic-type intramembrane protease [Pyrinomonadaceae bacterium]|nr:CPBP family glutamic-type intramembrane protease [Pyrinomonadaceae bacterium]
MEGHIHKSTTNAVVLQDRSLALWEIVSVSVSCLIGEWAIRPLAPGNNWFVLVPALLAMALMVLSHLERNETLRDIGFRLDNLFAAARLVAIPTLVAVIILIAGAWLVSRSEFTVRPLRARLLLAPAWALFQQYALQGFINRRAQIVFGPGIKSVSLVALLFCLFHLPSPFLAILTFVGGFALAAAYQRRPNLYALAAAHFAVSITLSFTAPTSFTQQLRVGFKYFGLSI